jgi:COP9 signalosome complex subunit 4
MIFSSNIKRTSDGFTIPEKAVVEHNMLAVYKLYENISFVELGTLLSLEPSRTEKVVAVC